MQLFNSYQIQKLTIFYLPQNEPNAGRNYIGTTLLELLRSCIKLKFIYLYVTAEAVKTFL